MNTNQTKDVTLRLIGTGVFQINEIRDKAMEDLDFNIEMRALSTEENNQIAIPQPGSTTFLMRNTLACPWSFPLEIYGLLM